MRRLQQATQEESSTRDRHAEYYLGLWNARENEMKSPRQWATARELGADIECAWQNLEKALVRASFDS